MRLQRRAGVRQVTLPWSAAEIGGLLCFLTDPDTGEAVIELPPPDRISTAEEPRPGITKS